MERTKSSTVLTGTSAAFNPATVHWEAVERLILVLLARLLTKQLINRNKKFKIKVQFVTSGPFQLVY